MTALRPRSEWRGVAAEDIDGELTRRDLGAAGRRAPAGCCGELLAAVQAGALVRCMVVVVVENAARLSIPYLVKEGIDTGIPPIRASGDLGPLLLVVGLVLGATHRCRPSPATSSWSGPAGSARTSSSSCAAGSSGTSRAQPGLPRPLHLRPGDLAADLRRRRDLRDARDRASTASSPPP